MPRGTIVNINADRGFGFIKPDGAQKKTKDVFFHATGMKDRDTFNEVQVGDTVTYIMDQDGERPRAIDVEVL